MFLFVIPAGLKRESIQNYGHFNLFTNEPKSQEIIAQRGFRPDFKKSLRKV
jgi:hypothetical protein